MFTADEQNPYIYEGYHPSTGYYFQPLVWGYTFSFRISWDHHPHPWIHTFVVTEHQGHFYIFQHTFHKGANVILPDLIAPDVSRIIDVNVKANVLVEPLNVVYGPHLDSCARNSYFSWWKSGPQEVCEIKDNQDAEQNDCTVDKFGRDTSGVGGKSKEEVSNVVMEETCSSEPRNLTILCFNIWNTNTVVKRQGEYSKRLERMGKVSRLVNSSGAEAEIFREDYVNTMAANALAMEVARASAAMVLIMCNKEVFVIHEKGFQLPAPSVKKIQV